MQRRRGQAEQTSGIIKTRAADASPIKVHVHSRDFSVDSGTACGVELLRAPRDIRARIDSNSSD